MKYAKNVQKSEQRMEWTGHGINLVEWTWKKGKEGRMEG